MNNSILNDDGHKKAEDDQEVYYSVEKILARRKNPRTKKYQYLLKWKGYDA